MHQCADSHYTFMTPLLLKSISNLRNLVSNLYSLEPPTHFFFYFFLNKHYLGLPFNGNKLERNI